MRSRSRTFGAVIGVVVFLACGTSLAYFTTIGSGSTDTPVSSLGKPVIASATPAAGGTVTLTWGAVSAPSAEPAVKYFVTRDGGDPAGTCAPETAPTTALTCVDKEVAPGTHSYTVTAVWNSWETTSAPKAATVAVGAATHFSISASTTTPLAGAVSNLTISARDVNESVVTTYTGSKSLTFSGASASPSGTAANVINSTGSTVNFGSATTISFTSGVAAVASSKNGVMKIYRAGIANVAVTDGTLSTETPLAVTVSPAALSKFVLGVESTTPAVGAADDLTITAQDAYGNVVTSHNGAKALTFSGGTTSGGGNVATVSNAGGEAVAFGAATSISFSEGVATVDGSANGEMRLYKSGAQTIKVAEGAIVSATVTVTPAAGSASKFAVSASATTFATTTGVSLTITAQDEFGNTATTYTGSKSLTFSGAAASPAGNAPTVAPASTTTGVAFGSPTAITFSNGVASAASSKNGYVRIYKVGPASITFTDGTIANPTPLALTVTVGALSKFVLAAESTTPVAGAADDLTITAQDAYGNVVTSHNGLKSLTFSGATAAPSGTVATVTDSEGNAVNFGTATPIAFSEGVALADGVKNGEMRLYKAVTVQPIKATEGSISGTLNVTPVGAAATKLALGSSATTLTAGGTANLTTTAQDAWGNTATTYAGAKAIVFAGASSSPGGTAPTVVNSAGTQVPFGSETELTFSAGVAAVVSSKNGLLRLYRAGVTPVTASTSDGSLTTSPAVSITVSAVAAGTSSKFVWTELKASAGTIGSPCLFTCAVTGLGNSATIKGKVAVTDTYGNPNSNIGTGHNAAVTVTGGGAVTGGTFTFPSTGVAEAPTEFTYTSQASGSYTATIKAAATAGTAYANATITATQ